MRLTKSQIASRTRIEQLAQQGLTPISLAAGIGAALSLAIPNDGYRIFGTDPSTLLINRLLAATDTDDWARREWLDEVYLRADPLPYVELPTLMRLRIPVVASHAKQAECWGFPADILATIRADDHERAFFDLGSPHGGTILANFSAGGRWVASMQMYRRDPQHQFRRSEVAFVRSVGGTIGDALATAMQLERAALPSNASDQPSGVLILAPDSEPTFSSPVADEMLAMLRDSDARNGSHLPSPVAAAVAGLRSNGKPRQQVTTPTPLGLIAIEASSGGRDGSVAVVLTLQKPAGPPAVPLNWPLTPQEREIVQRLVSGDSNRAIAESLFISENTVQTHLRNIYGKLEVSSRNQLLARLFHATQ